MAGRALRGREREHRGQQRQKGEGWIASRVGRDERQREREGEREGRVAGELEWRSLGAEAARSSAARRAGHQAAPPNLIPFGPRGLQSVSRRSETR